MDVTPPPQAHSCSNVERRHLLHYTSLRLFVLFNSCDLHSPTLILSYSSKINIVFFSSEGFFCTWPKWRDMFSEGYDAHPVGCAYRNCQLAHFFKNLNFLVGCGSPLLTIMAVWRTSNWKKGSQTAITICSELSNLTRSLNRIVCRGKEVKAL